jgi:hypothetical protein
LAECRRAHHGPWWPSARSPSYRPRKGSRLGVNTLRRLYGRKPWLQVSKWGGDCAPPPSAPPLLQGPRGVITYTGFGGAVLFGRARGDADERRGRAGVGIHGSVFGVSHCTPHTRPVERSVLLATCDEKIHATGTAWRFITYICMRGVGRVSSARGDSGLATHTRPIA